MAKKGENIYKRKDGRWEARYIKGYTPAREPRYGYCYAKTYREAKEKVARAKTLGAGDQAAEGAARRRLSHYCEEWLHLSRARVKESTYIKYYTSVEKHIKPGLGDCPVRALSSLLVEEFGRTLLCDKGLAPKTVRDILAVLRLIFAYIERNYPGCLPAVEIVCPKENKKEMRVLTRAEQTAFMNYLLQDMDEGKFGVLLALLTGMRIGEVCALRWGDVCLAERTIRVRATMQRLQNLEANAPGKTKIVISEPKSDHSVRVIPLTGFAAALCEQRRAQSAAAFVLTGREDRYLEPRALQYRLKRYTQACGLAGVHFHTLRHSFATRCVEVDFEIKSLSEILGHSSPRITLERYVHSSLELKHSNMEKLAAIGC